MIPEGRVGITWHPVEFTSFFRSVSVRLPPPFLKELIINRFLADPTIIE